MRNHLSYVSICLVHFAILIIGCKKNDPVPEELPPLPAKTNPNLIHFGFTLVDVFWDDPNDNEVKTNYIDEIADFSNLADLLVIEPSDDLHDRLALMETHNVKGLLHLNELFFEYIGPVDIKSGADYDLRADYKERWDEFVATNNFDSDVSRLGAFYLGEEPTWNSISAEDFALASDYIKETVPEIPILLIEAYPAIEELIVPSSVDWIGFDHYFISDPVTNETFQSELTHLKLKKLDHQNIVLIMDAHYIPFAHGSTGLAKTDMDVVARNYYLLANKEPSVIGLIGYHWPSGFDFNSAIGARELPAHVKAEHQQIGRAITGK